jgi:hypothetical protein
MREEQVIETLTKSAVAEGAVQESLLRLEKSGKIKKVTYREKVFWLPEEEKRSRHSSCHDDLIGDERDE